MEKGKRDGRNDREKVGRREGGRDLGGVRDAGSVSNRERNEEK